MMFKSEEDLGNKRYRANCYIINSITNDAVRNSRAVLCNSNWYTTNLLPSINGRQRHHYIQIHHLVKLFILTGFYSYHCQYWLTFEIYGKAVYCKCESETRKMSRTGKNYDNSYLEVNVTSQHLIIWSLYVLLKLMYFWQTWELNRIDNK